MWYIYENNCYVLYNSFSAILAAWTTHQTILGLNNNNKTIIENGKRLILDITTSLAMELSLTADSCAEAVCRFSVCL